MTSLNQNLFNPLLRDTHAHRIAELLSAFPSLQSIDRSPFLSLWKFLDARPHKFFCRYTFDVCFRRLLELDAAHKHALLSFLRDQMPSINNAYRHADEVCELDWHDRALATKDDYALLVTIDQDLHPAYLRLTEAVLRPLLRLPAYFSRLDRGKGTDNLDLHQIAEELKSSEFEKALSAYDPLVRNGIAHGGVTYSENHVHYQDKRGNSTTLQTRDIVRKFDDLLDTCNALLVAFSIFSLTRDDSRYKLPTNLLIDELKTATRTPYWNVAGCLPPTQSHQNQLVVHVRIDSMDSAKIHLSLFQTAILAERLAPDYARYFFSFRSEKCWPGFAAFAGQKLAQLRTQDAPLEQYGNVLEGNLLFFVPKWRLPRLLAKVETLRLIYKIQKPLIAADVRRKLGWFNILVRATAIHRNSWGIVLESHVVIGRDAREIDQELIRRQCGRIVRKSLSVGRRNLSRFDICRYLPLGFCTIHVFRNDHRVRRLVGFGLKSDLVCTIKVQRLRRIKSPDILGATIETNGRYRIAWNRGWLQEVSRDFAGCAAPAQ